MYLLHKAFKKVMFKSIIDNINMNLEYVVDDKEFWIDIEKYKEKKNNKYCRLRLLKDVSTEKLELNMLLQNGLKAAQLI